jgi:membrane-bound lytic murein transglycosylase D
VSNEAAIYAYSANIFNTREKALPELTKTSSRVRYKVRSGDYLGKIANRYGVRVSQIKRWNGLRTNTISIGQRLTIYPRKPVTTVSKSKKKPTKKNQKSTSGASYTVVSGDT